MVGLTRTCFDYVCKSVASILRSPDQANVTAQGWLRSVRSQKKFVFASLSDGLGPETLQLVFSSSPETKGLSVNSFVQVSGVLVLTPDRQQPAELRCQRLDMVRHCPSTEGYPFPARSSPTWQQARQHVHLRSRLGHAGAVLRARAGVTRALHEHMERHHYLHVDTPVLTANDCEGAGDVFTVKAATDAPSELAEQRSFFGRDVHLTVSGQLHLEAITSGVTHVYTLSPAFRAERSRTRRHLAEFRMLEAEMAPARRLEELTDALEQLTREVTAAFLERCGAELELILPDRWRQQQERLQQLQAADFPRLTHAEAVAVLRRRPDLGQPARPDADLSRHHELALLDHCGQRALFVTDWPAHLKPFYARRDGHTAAAVDLLVPGVGELAGGSLREDGADQLTARLQQLGLLPQLDWYVQLRRYGGAPTAGYGLGLERLLLLLTGLESVRDVVPFPRWFQHCDT